jgi:hypothetical protein
MSREADDKISSTLERFGIPMAGNVWRVQGTPVIYHRTLEEIAAQLGIIFQPPTILRSERDEAVMIVHGSMQLRAADGGLTDKTRHEWSIGEAVINVNYRVSGKQAAYVYAMAEKRAKDRVILKLIELAGHVYSEEEADEFSESARRQAQQAQRDQQAQAADEPDNDPAKIDADIRKRITEANTIESLRDMMLEERTQQAVAYLAPGIRDDLRAFASARLKALGWVSRPGSQRSQSTPRSNDNRQVARR